MKSPAAVCKRGELYGLHFDKKLPVPEHTYKGKNKIFVINARNITKMGLHHASSYNI